MQFGTEISLLLLLLLLLILTAAAATTSSPRPTFFLKTRITLHKSLQLTVKS